MYLRRGCRSGGKRSVDEEGGAEGVSSSPPYRTVLSESRSQSLERRSSEEETAAAAAGCWSTASSGTRARLSPLKDIAGSGRETQRRCHDTQTRPGQMTMNRGGKLSYGC